jgi:hypothetical protein
MEFRDMLGLSQRLRFVLSVLDRQTAGLATIKINAIHELNASHSDIQDGDHDTEICLRVMFVIHR